MNRLQTRLILAFSLVILVVLCGVSTALLLILRDSSTEERELYLGLNTQAASIIAIMRRLPRSSALRLNDYAQLRDLAAREGIRIAWANADGEILFDSAGRWNAPPTANILTQLRRAAGGRLNGRMYDAGQRWLVVAHPVPNAENTRNYLVLASPAPSVIGGFLRRFRQTLLVPLLQAGAVALAVGLLLATLISHSIARPLRNVADAARALAAGELDARAPVAGPEEVRSLATTFNEMAGQVQRSQQAQRDLVANVAHDLRTPLTSIQGFAQALLDGAAASPDAKQQAAGIIHEEAQRMHKMANALLDLARFEAGQVTLKIEPLDLAEMARRSVQRFQPQAEEKGVKLAVGELNSGNAPPSSHNRQLTTLPADPDRLAQVLDNLLANALTHTPSGGQIKVLVGGTEREALLAVTDTGAGIPPEELPRIFERFYRGDRSRSEGAVSPGSGTGLGLAIVREIIHAHGGTIAAESVVGIGTKFTVRLPRS